jgi:hypothetical protein
MAGKAHEAAQLTGVLHNLTRQYHDLARRPDVRKPMLAVADKLLKSKDVDGQVAIELEIASTNLKVL